MEVIANQLDSHFVGYQYRNGIVVELELHLIETIFNGTRFYSITEIMKAFPSGSLQTRKYCDLDNRLSVTLIFDLFMTVVNQEIKNSTSQQIDITDLICCF